MKNHQNNNATSYVEVNIKVIVLILYILYALNLHNCVYVVYIVIHQNI